jgi:hypothetical protein
LRKIIRNNTVYAEDVTQHVKNQRAKRYREETDALYLKAVEESILVDEGDTYLAKVDKVKWQTWIDAKNTIRAELPYPTE